jgi:hypothetical protein
VILANWSAWKDPSHSVDGQSDSIHSLHFGLLWECLQRAFIRRLMCDVLRRLHRAFLRWHLGEVRVEKVGKIGKDWND